MSLAADPLSQYTPAAKRAPLIALDATPAGNLIDLDAVRDPLPGSAAGPGLRGSLASDTVRPSACGAVVTCPVHSVVTILPPNSGTAFP